MEHASIILHEMPGWEESADRPVMAPVLRPGDTFPPRPPETDRRRRPRWPLWIAAVVVLAMGAGVAIYLAGRRPASSSAAEVAGVRKAYLAWWGADKEAYSALDPTPLRAFTTDAGYKQEADIIAQQRRANEPLDVVAATHNMQIVVYRGNKFASVDDIWKSESVPLDPTTRSPTGQPNGDFVERSSTMKKVGGRWFLDDSGTFGASSADVSGTAISYATVPGDAPSPAVRTDLIGAFAKFMRVRAQAYMTLDSSLLATIELQPQLGTDQKGITDQVAQKQAIQYEDQDNYRLGMQDPTHAWIYDTALDSSLLLNPETRQPLRPAHAVVVRLRFSLVQGPNGWMVDGVGEN